MKEWDKITDEACKGAEELLRRLSDENPADETYLCEKVQERTKYDSQRMLQRWKRERMRRIMVRWSVAASFVLLASLSVYLWQRAEDTPLMVVEEIAPGHTKAILTLADGTIKNLVDTALTITLQNITTVDSLTTRSGDTAQVYHTLTVARGGEFAMTLPDGSKVWLNSESELKFPNQFDESERRVFLKGEGYFEVAKETKPFRVELQEGTIQVYGTQFNVSNYEMGRLAATLVEGSIGFTALSGKSTRLAPSQHLQYSESEDRLIVTTVNPLIYTAWKNNLFCFEEQSLEEIMKVLGRWYDIETEFETEDLKALKLSGTLEKYADITQFFRLFEFSSNIKFEVNQRKVTIKQK